ncbi:holin [Sporanaerobium hydrogeniformans]|uniref:Holin n=1 Tax=Sporanaerobium hydrogeniformans TaxID=3072179 RepID=A0AC61DB15_9FIRM|nr:phage holin family protein [Sporanaerobium hydrogeniformans]PHV69787.1 holin [Sporanaerobium hydrogeniformans]
MEKYFNNFSLVLGAIGGFSAGMLGGWDILLKTMIILIILDYVTGILKGIYNKELSSAVGYKGIIKKVMILILIALAYALQSSIDTSLPLREIVNTFFIANEGISILENAVGCGLPIPAKLKELLIQLRGDDEDADTASIANHK